MRIKRSWRLLVVVAISLLIGYAFLAGPLFAWSPIKPGYDVIRLERADVYFGKGISPDAALRDVDQFIRETEQFHQMQLQRRMTIIVCRSWSISIASSHCSRRKCRRRHSGVRDGDVFDAENSGDEIRSGGVHPARVVTRGAGTKFDAVEQPSIQAVTLVYGRTGRACRKSEGIRLLRRFQKRIAQQSIEPLFARQPYRTLGFDQRFAYLTWRYFLAWRTETRGRAALQQYLQSFMKPPQESEQLFREVYGEDLFIAVRMFETAVRSKRWRSTGL